ncbi:hypothetical protein GCM10010320_81890 [Streptomyces caelestis]|nr:hypothetical protein GCM10010320_81890 [Streptomyces caelestis]
MKGIKDVLNIKIRPTHTSVLNNTYDIQITFTYKHTYKESIHKSTESKMQQALLALAVGFGDLGELNSLGFFLFGLCRKQHEAPERKRQKKMSSSMYA